MRKIIGSGLVCICLLMLAGMAAGQERTGPLFYNPQHAQPVVKNHLQKKTAISLPFFEDFTGYSQLPDITKWVESEVYVNNTMCVNPISRGVATFDALNAIGLPYDTLSNTGDRYSDSLTSQPIDLSGNTPADSVYLSFFYQPQGLGFFPSPQDSFVLFMRKSYGDWVKVWSTPGTTVQPFVQVMIPITDTIFFYNTFQFRFVNIAALQYADAVWNLDYIRLDANRNMYDTAVNDVAFTTSPSFLLNDYSYMPYRQYIANAANERASQFTDSIRNNYNVPQNVSYGFEAHDVASGTLLTSAGTNTVNIGPVQVQPVTTPTYSSTVPLGGLYDKVVFENKFYLQSISTTDSRPNDTIIRNQVFDNYLAYDDGTAEQSYYLNLFPTLPGKIALDYHLNQPDTLQGLAIYFGRQVPLAHNRLLSLVVYNSLAGVDGALSDNVLYQQDLLFGNYADTVNNFFVYRFDHPVPLPAGTFYAGTLQPPSSGSDSLYLGLDRNRVGGNHTYYNVLDTWNSSLVQGAIMIRPLLGQPVTGTRVTNITGNALPWNITPNPAANEVRFTYSTNRQATYEIYDMQGRIILSGATGSGKSVNITALAKGIYFVTLVADGIAAQPQKLIKE